MLHFQDIGASSNNEAPRNNARLGLVLFVVYLVLYGGFVWTSAFAPKLLEQLPIAGLNVAILYGMGLIAAAILLAFVYGILAK